MNKIRVAVNGYGVIGRRVADAIAVQPDMELTGICDVATDWRIKSALMKGYNIYGYDEETSNNMNEAGIRTEGNLHDLLGKIDVVIDCSPKKIGAKNIEIYKEKKIRYILQGGEKHESAGHSFVAEENYESALNKLSTRVVSCNTTSIVRTLGALQRKGLLKKARGTLLRRATDPMESHRKGIMNTVVPEKDIPSHQGPDAQKVIPSLDVVTMAVQIPETIGHVHFWNVELTKETTKEEILDAFRTSSRIGFLKMGDGFNGINTIREFMSDMERSRANLYEVAVWEDLMTVQGNELFYAYMVDNQAIVIPETIDAIRALTGRVKTAKESIAMTNRSLEIGLDLSGEREENFYMTRQGKAQNLSQLRS